MKEIMKELSWKNLKTWEWNHILTDVVIEVFAFLKFIFKNTYTLQIYLGSERKLQVCSLNLLTSTNYLIINVA